MNEAGCVPALFRLAPPVCLAGLAAWRHAESICLNRVNRAPTQLEVC
jgi:hypothetical protein